MAGGTTKYTTPLSSTVAFGQLLVAHRRAVPNIWYNSQ
jgi:hypothetical protein